MGQATCVTCLKGLPGSCCVRSFNRIVLRFRIRIWIMYDVVDFLLLEAGSLSGKPPKGAY